MSGFGLKPFDGWTSSTLYPRMSRFLTSFSPINPHALTTIGDALLPWGISVSPTQAHQVLLDSVADLVHEAKFPEVSKISRPLFRRLQARWYKVGVRYPLAEEIALKALAQLPTLSLTTPGAQSVSTIDKAATLFTRSMGIGRHHSLLADYTLLKSYSQHVSKVNTVRKRILALANEEVYESFRRLVAKVPSFIAADLMFSGKPGFYLPSVHLPFVTSLAEKLVAAAMLSRRTKYDQYAWYFLGQHATLQVADKLGASAPFRGFAATR
jgi:hypothetical protein